MKLSNAVLGSIGVYQVMRFILLGLTFLTDQSLHTHPIIANGVIALAGGALVIPVLIIQFVLTREQTLVTPLAIGKFLELGTTALLFRSLLPTFFLDDPGSYLRVVVSILLFADTIVFLFLLLLPRKDV